MSFRSTSKCVDNAWIVVSDMLHLLYSVWVLKCEVSSYAHSMSSLTRLILAKSHFLKALIFSHWRHTQTSVGYCNSYCKTRWWITHAIRLISKHINPSYLSIYRLHSVNCAHLRRHILFKFAFFTTNLFIKGFRSSCVLIFPLINLRLLQQVSIGLSKLVNCLRALVQYLNSATHNWSETRHIYSVQSAGLGYISCKCSKSHTLALTYSEEFFLRYKQARMS